MYSFSSSLFVILPLLVASTMAFPYDFPPFNYPPYNNYYPPYNNYYPPYNFPTPPSPDTYYGAPPPPRRHPAPPRRSPAPPRPKPHYPAPPPPASGNNKVQRAFLRGQNAARKAIKRANLPPFVWNDTVAAYASKYAEERKDCQLVHSQTQLYGENIAEGSDLSIEQAVGLWVDEKSSYDYNTNECTGGEQCGHYTQVIWRKTTQIGCARVSCNSGGFFVTCNYFPPGNYIGERPY